MKTLLKIGGLILLLIIIGQLGYVTHHPTPAASASLSLDPLMQACIRAVTLAELRVPHPALDTNDVAGSIGKTTAGAITRRMSLECGVQTNQSEAAVAVMFKALEERR
jgi:hypothetical protein